MIAALLTGMALAAQAPAEVPAATPLQLSAPSQAALRCSAAFALVSYDRAAGVPAASKWPDIDDRGREYFVRTLAKIMDETGLDRDQVAALTTNEARRLLDSGELDQVMPACLILLDASGI